MHCCCAFNHSTSENKKKCSNGFRARVCCCFCCPLNHSILRRAASMHRQMNKSIHTHSPARWPRQLFCLLFHEEKNRICSIGCLLLQRQMSSVNGWTKCDRREREKKTELRWCIQSCGMNGNKWIMLFTHWKHLFLICVYLLKIKMLRWV